MNDRACSAGLVKDDNLTLEQSAQELFEEAPCGYLAALPDGTIVRVNQTFLALSGYTRELLLAGKNFRELLSLPGRIYCDTHLGPLLHMQGFVREVAFDLLRADRSCIPVLLNCVLKKNADGEPTFIWITVFDASDRRTYERELLRARQAADLATENERRQRAEAEQANRAKDDFLALVSHELRTPLSAILAWTQVLRGGDRGADDIEEGLAVIERSTLLQARLIDDLLDMSRIAAGKMRLDVQRVELAAVIEAALQVTAPALQARSIRVQTTLESGIAVAGDPDRLQQVFWNLFSNAAKFTPSHGSLEVVMQRNDPHVEVSVIDTGQGMTPELLAHAFERFRQSSDGDMRRTRGLGLGLSIVKYLVEMHGGLIEAHSEGKDRGSTFVVKLPVVAAFRAEEHTRTHRASVAHVPPSLPSITLSGVRVLVVDDERDAREILWRILSDHGAEVIACASAAEALETVQRAPPDVLVSDIAMPGEDGYELIRRVRMLGGDSGCLPAVALTAFSALEDRTQALLAGYQVHMAKPIDARELTLAIASLVGRLERAHVQ